MAGYSYENWKSNNAITADGDDELFKKTTLDIAILKNSCDDATLKKYKITKKLILHLINEDAIKYQEWHHTGKLYAKTYYYNYSTVLDFLNGGKNHFGQTLDFYYNSYVRSINFKKKYGSIEKKAVADFVEFYKSGGRWRPDFHNEIKGIVRGNWFHFGKNQKKNINGKNITIKYL